ncbi:unnamed protein product [Auanema sp. JU1783]|nr:unnamed protein product [Auanema sp. JU1783]
MDLVVYLSLAVLATVFLVSLIILLLMCRRRKLSFGLPASNQYFRFSKMSNDNIEGLTHLSPLMAQMLDKNSWVCGVSGLLQHCVALLRLCHTFTEKMSTIPLDQVGPQLNKIFCEATLRIMPRFDDLLESVSSPHIDIRVLEARATALATVCWTLYLPTTLLGPKDKEMVSDPLIEMEAHLKILREAAILAARAEIGKLDVDWSRIADDDEDDEDDDEIDDVHESTKNQGSIEIESLPLVDMSKSSTVDTRIDEDDRPSNGSSHPIDPSA